MKSNTAKTQTISPLTLEVLETMQVKASQIQAIANMALGSHASELTNEDLDSIFQIISDLSNAVLAPMNHVLHLTE